MASEWRNDPATQKQKDKLLFFGCTFDDGITKGQASDAINHCVANFPELEKAYQDRPATKEQMKKVRAYLKKNGEEIADYAANGKTLAYQEAKEIVEDYDEQLEDENEKLNWQRLKANTSLMLECGKNHILALLGIVFKRLQRHSIFLVLVGEMKKTTQI